MGKEGAEKKRRKGRKCNLYPSRQRKNELFNCPTVMEIWSLKPHKQLRTRCISCTPLPRESLGDQGNVNALWKKKTYENKCYNHDYIESIAYKSLIFLYYSRIVLHFRKNIRNKKPCCLSCTFPGYNLDFTHQREQSRVCEAADPPFPAEDILPKSKASPQLSWGWCSNPLFPTTPTIPDLLLPSSIQTPVLSIFVGAGFQDLKLMLSHTEIPFMKTTSCSATESWLRKAIYNTSALSLPLKDHWQVQLTPGQTYHCTF